jgi:hypothetical protein
MIPRALAYLVILSAFWLAVLVDMWHSGSQAGGFLEAIVVEGVAHVNAAHCKDNRAIACDMTDRAALREHGLISSGSVHVPAGIEAILASDASIMPRYTGAVARAGGECLSPGQETSTVDAEEGGI